MKDAHSSVPYVVFHHLGVSDAVVNVIGGVLEDASGAESTFVRTINEVLANRRQILFVQVLFPLEFILTVGKTTAKSVRLIVTDLTFEPELAKLCLDLPLPLHWSALHFAFLRDFLTFSQVLLQALIEGRLIALT